MTKPVVDADTHVVEGEHIWEYLTQAEKKHRPLIVASPADASGQVGKTFWVIDGELYAKGGQQLITYPDGTRDMRDIATRIRQMKEFGVDIQTIYPSIFLGLTAKQPETELALVRAYNRWLAEVCAPHASTMKWLAVPSTMNIEATVSDMKTWSDKGACGLVLKGFEGERTLNHPSLRPLYARASELGLPICVHIGTSSRGFRGIEGVSNAVGLVTPNVIGFCSLICSTLPTDFPDLKFGFIESGAEWLRFAISRAERYENRYGVKNNTARMLESRRLFVTCEHHEDINYIAERVGPNCLMMGTDYGHSDTSTELKAPAMLAARSDIDPALASLITRDNPAAFYRM